MRHHLANRFVIGDHTRWRRIDAITNRLPIDFDLIAKLDALTYMRWLVVDGDTPSRMSCSISRREPSLLAPEPLCSLRLSTCGCNTCLTGKASASAPRHRQKRPDTTSAN